MTGIISQLVIVDNKHDYDDDDKNDKDNYEHGEHSCTWKSADLIKMSLSRQPCQTTASQKSLLTLIPFSISKSASETQIT